LRFDPVWRRIKADTITTKLEGQFAERLARLEGLNNWGALSWLYDHASASKQAHHFGLEWNAIKFLDGDETRAKHQTSLRIAAHIAHWGHLPLSYAGEEALVRAAHVDSSAAEALDRIVANVITFGQLQCDDKGHDCASAMRAGDRPFEIYRWLAAWLAKSHWNRLWKAATTGVDPRPHETATKLAVVETRVCRHSRGFRVLERCNQADYVPRDLLQAGTAWLTFDIEALWEGNPLGSDAAKEWSLVDAALSYLNGRFFHTPEALLVHSLACRAIAAGLLADGIALDSISKLLTQTDGYWLLRLKPHHRRRLRQLRAEVPRISETWELVGSFADVSMDRGTRLQMEDQLSRVRGKSRITYPFSTGVSVIVEPGATMFRGDANFVGSGRQFATVHVHRRISKTGECAARPTLNVVARVSERIAPSDQFGDQVASWLMRDKVEQRWDAGERVCGDIVVAEGEAVRRAIERIPRLKSVQEVLEFRIFGAILRALADEDFLRANPGMAALVLRLPWRLLRFGPGHDLLAVVREAALDHTASGPRATRGYALELAVAADQLLEPSSPAHRFLFLGATRLGKDGQPANEWDVLRLDLDRGNTWSLTAIECAIKRDTAKDQEARDKLEVLQRRVADRFTDLSTYQTLIATAGRGAVSYADAGRSWTHESQLDVERARRT
jgi:hypothetical protein